MMLDVYGIKMPPQGMIPPPAWVKQKPGMIDLVVVSGLHPLTLLFISTEVGHSTEDTVFYIRFGFLFEFFPKSLNSSNIKKSNSVKRTGRGPDNV